MRLLPSLALFAAAIALASPARAQQAEAAQANEADAAGPRRYPPSSVRPRIIVAGIAVAGLAYGGALLGAALAPDLPGMDDMRIPIAGPWISLAQMSCPAEEEDCSAELVLRGILTVADGLMQLGGLAIVGEGIFMTTEATSPEAPKPQAFTVRAAPIVTGSMTGVGITGTF
ncbi:MAG TPA: hypothetical protein VE093_25045 [Polyangiaceae bacterium]|nr:hypothetical protein [Polyangiaceae bacterium]